MAEFPALPLWTDAYLADTSHLGDDEHGRYLLMLFHLWRMPQLRFPNEDQWLARKFGRSVADIEKLFRPLIVEFFRSDGNWVTHKRLASEWEYLTAKRKQQSDAAKSRWNKHKQSTDAYADRNAVRNAPTPTPTPTPIIELVETAKAKERAPATRWPPNKEVGFEWKFDAEQKRREMSLPDIDLHLEAEKFANFWSSKSGKDATKVDWHRTWINWCLNAKGLSNGNGKAPSAHDKFLAGTAAYIQDQLGSDDGPPGEGNGGDAARPPGRPLLPR